MKKVTINDQPVAASFFGEGRMLTSFVTPEAPDVRALYKTISKIGKSANQNVLACWEWVANNVRYVDVVQGTLIIDGQRSDQPDYWQTPSMIIHTRVGNCANKAFLAASLIRNALPAHQVKVVLGNLHQPDPGGHAWVQITTADRDRNFVFETTRGDMPPWVTMPDDGVYEPVIYFNDKTVEAVPGKALLRPFATVYVAWLKDYLDSKYVGGL